MVDIRRIVVILLAVLVSLTACGGAGAEANSPGEVSERVPPTFPPTFTPKPTVTVQPTVTLHPTGEPTLTITLTLSAVPAATSTRRPPPSDTPTWTPDADVTARPTSTPGTPDFEVSTPLPQSGQAGCLRSATAPNLLLNPDFEEGSHTQTYGDVNVPDKWLAFWKEGGEIDYDPNNSDGYLRPEFILIPDAPPYINPDRVLSGEQAFYLFGGNRVFDAGIFQKIAVTPGEMLCLTGFAHAWSSQDDDPFDSTLDTDDDRRNANFLLGIDPEGGTLPWVDSVIWGEIGHLYDAYQPIPGVEVRAESEMITVFVRGYSLWRFAHNDFFFDDISLQRVGS